MVTSKVILKMAFKGLAPHPVLKHYMFKHVAQGLQHVDDAAVFSKVLCTECMERLVSRLWPEDVGVSKEEEGPIIRLLNAILVVEGSIVKAFPYCPTLHLRMSGV